jgi:hypothetical protein
MIKLVGKEFHSKFILKSVPCHGLKPWHAFLFSKAMIGGVSNRGMVRFIVFLKQSSVALRTVTRFLSHLTNIYLSKLAGNYFSLLTFVSNFFNPLWTLQSNPAVVGTFLLKYRRYTISAFHVKDRADLS